MSDRVKLCRYIKATKYRAYPYGRGIIFPVKDSDWSRIYTIWQRLDLTKRQLNAFPLPEKHCQFN